MAVNKYICCRAQGRFLPHVLGHIQTQLVTLASFFVGHCNRCSPKTAEIILRCMCVIHFIFFTFFSCAVLSVLCPVSSGENFLHTLAREPFFSHKHSLCVFVHKMCMCRIIYTDVSQTSQMQT